MVSEVADSSLHIPFLSFPFMVDSIQYDSHPIAAQVTSAPTHVNLKDTVYLTGSFSFKYSHRLSLEIFEGRISPGPTAFQ